MVANLFKLAEKNIEDASTQRVSIPSVRTELLKPTPSEFEVFHARRRTYNDTLTLILDNMDDVYATDITFSPAQFLAAAQAVLAPTDKLPALDMSVGAQLKDRATPCVNAFTFAVLPSREPLRDTAVIFSYDHHGLRTIKDAFTHLNPKRISNSAIAPKVVGYRDVVANNGAYTGALLVVEGIHNLDEKTIKAQRYPQQRVYEMMTLNLRAAVIARNSAKEVTPPKAPANNVVQFSQRPR